MSRERGAWLGLLLLAVVVGLIYVGRAYGDTIAHRKAAEVRMVLHTFGNTQLGWTMVCIVNRETYGTWNPRAWNHTDHHADGSYGSFGLFQIGALWRNHGETVTHFRWRMWNPRANIAKARWLFIRHGLQPWGGGCG